MKKFLSYFSPFERGLWLLSTIAVVLSFLLGKDSYPLTLIASLVGVSALILIAKGNVIGQFLTVAFSILYAIVSLRFRYYGEMITYLFMSAPAAVFACVSWIRNPAQKGKNEVKVGTMTIKKWLAVSLIALITTIVFYFILRRFNTENLIPSTLSITTSVFAAVLLFLRSRFYAIAYALNDVVLIVLWVLASFSSISYLPMVICFFAFLANDLYAFYNWKKMQLRQNASTQF